ncbi:MAG: hypothetical protein IKU53_01245 [Firmicutes bacterium]|nr:hypothetical protein [Bacillota bacterium]
MYDTVITPNFVDNIQYGIIDGNSTILLIKGGQGADILGYNDKYLKIAFNVNKKYGCTVITASNKEFSGANSLEPTMRMIEKYCEGRNFTHYKVFYMGVSNGALLGSWYSFKYPEIKKLLLINSPIKARNYHYVIGGLEASEAEKITLVYGKEDFSYPYVSLLNPLFIIKENIHFEEVEGADHHFAGKLDEFMALPEKYLF